ncbi:SphA family protein [Lichenicoccus sp.]|uniref:SphA family protein n=1 Tax=Lichenicoccus sp. TaxID=2781899 RepID=UPI003D0DE4DC
MGTSKWWPAVGAAAMLMSASGIAQATENDQTHVDLAFIDNLGGYPLPSGFYLRGDVNYIYSDQLNDRNGNPVTVNAGILGKYPLKYYQSTTAEVLTALYVPPFKIPVINATVGTGFYLPYASSRAEAQDTIFGQTSGSGETRRGFGDMTVVPIFLQAAIPHTDLYVTLSPLEFTAPTGQYNPNDAIGNSIGTNYWSYRPAVVVTYLNRWGQEATINYNMSFNSQNDATKYKSGDELSFTYLLQQHFSPTFAIGAEGYFYDQFTNDTQNGVVVNTVRSPDPLVPFDPLNEGPGNRGQVFAIGPAVNYAPTQRFVFNFHYEHEVFAYDRREGEVFWLRGVVKF